MLNAGDIEFMRSSQDEIYTRRKRPLSVIYTETIRDNITGQIIGREDVEREVYAVITELTTKKQNGGRYVEDGIEYEQGDAKFDVKIELIEDIADKITQINHSEVNYEILGIDRKGIGERNRFEIIGRVMA